MAPSTHIEVAPEQKKKKENPAEPLVVASRPKVPIAPAVKANLPGRPAEGSFQSSMLEYNRMKSSSRLMDISISLAVNACFLIVPIFAGLY
ncbi:MAG: hypothetical protein WBL63_04580, partial [Candidatus Acidiferrum sp.]